MTIDCHSTVPPPMMVALSASFGSFALWRVDLASAVARHRSVPGRVVLGFVPSLGRLVNAWLDDGRSPTSPLMALATMTAPRDEDASADAVAAFIDGIDWTDVHRTYQEVIGAASSSWGAGASAIEGAMVIDVRRREVFEAADDRIVDAIWHDPAEIGSWVDALPRFRRIVVYCVAGHEMSRGTALRLRAEGWDARFLSGGIEAWKRAGRPVLLRASDDSKTDAAPWEIRPPAY